MATEGDGEQAGGESEENDAHEHAHEDAKGTGGGGLGEWLAACHPGAASWLGQFQEEGVGSLQELRAATAPAPTLHIKHYIIRKLCIYSLFCCALYAIPYYTLVRLVVLYMQSVLIR